MPSVLDLFCGAGGLSRGLQDAGFHILAGVDNWNVAIETYKKNNSHLAVCADLSKLSAKEFEKTYKISKVDVIVGGPPCQGFSNAGKRDKNDPRNSLFMNYVEYLNHYLPKVFLFENVMGLLTMRFGEDNKLAIDVILEHLGENYDCVVNKLYASDFDVPQNRRRVIILGARKDLKIPKDLLTVKPVTKERIPASTILEKNVPKKYFLSQKAIDGINKKKERMKEEGKGFGAQILDISKPAYTICARYWKDGYDCLIEEKEGLRRLTEREIQRIQTFPEDYEFVGTKKDVIMQLGNAVPCKFAFHLGKVLETILSSTL